MNLAARIVKQAGRSGIMVTHELAELVAVAPADVVIGPEEEHEVKGFDVPVRVHTIGRTAR